jgi:glutamate racemase
MDKHSPIGIFDSGLGGISVLAQARKQLPTEDILYFGDSLWNPYGTKTKEEVTRRCIEICDAFQKEGVKAIVVACNTATSACIPLLRQRYPFPVIGMEPALKVACDMPGVKKTAVWATELTLKEEKFAALAARFPEEDIRCIPCPDLVQLVEQERFDDAPSALAGHLIESGDVQAVVLGCTHFVFFKDMLEKMRPDLIVVDGNEGTIRHLKDLLEQAGLRNETGGRLDWRNSDASKLELSKRLLDKLEETK